jgi:uncharacterized protein (DUF2336 family)
MTTGRDIDGEHLFQLARDKSQQSRAQLAAVISDLFDERKGALTDRERSLMYAILQGVVHEVEMSVRKTVAERLAEAPDVPWELVTTLANDEIEVAYPILKWSGLLKDADLIDVIRMRTLEHQLAIATRRQVSEAVADALVETGSEGVIVTLLKNADARISEKTMEYLVDQSQRVDTFQEPILRRRDLNHKLAKKMFLWVSAALRQFILDRYELDQKTVDDLLERTVVDEIETALAERGSGNKVKELAEVLRSEGLVTPEMLVTALKEGEIPLFIGLFCRLADLREYLVTRILFEPGGEGLAIACRSMGIGKAHFSSIFGMAQMVRAESADAVRGGLPKALAFYDDISAEAALSVVQRWRRGSEYLAAIRELQQRLRSNA